MDITERKQLEQKLAEMATHDHLTGLPNRLLLSDRLAVGLAQAQRNNTSLAVMMLDLDRFKTVNDTFGHGVGDELLKVAGGRLIDLVRKSDTVARMGGDEFVVLLLQIAKTEDAVRVAQKILETFQKPFAIDAYQIRITTSIGIAIYPEDGEDIETLFRNADTAMYWAKEQGRDNYELYWYDGTKTL
ncbi:MAG: GGDEF domain-containing protein [Chloroflexi bacterium]|nr:GGDEF domain-containing protein [Chloroflexota bacterium]